MHDPTPAHTDKRPGIPSVTWFFLNFGLIGACSLFIRVFWMDKSYGLPYSILAGLGLGIGLAGLYLWVSKENFKSKTGKFSIALAVFLTLALTAAFHVAAS